MKFIVALMLLAGTALAQGSRDQAFSVSAALEEGGDLATARAVLEQAYGPAPESYDVTLRLAWLSLRLKEARRAQELYERARVLEGAGPDATHGLASALALEGYQHLELGARHAARSRFERSLALWPDEADARTGLRLLGAGTRLAPELWGAYVHQWGAASRSTAATTLLSVPVVLADRFRLRGTWRHVEPVGTTSGREEDLGVAAALVDGRYSVEVAGLAVLPAGGPRAAGLAGRAHLGFRAGLAVAGSALHRADGWTSQVAPLLFVWLHEQVGLLAGVRATSDGGAQLLSPTAGVSLRHRRLQLDLVGHLGTERWPVNLDALTVLPLAADLTRGATLSGALRLSASLDLLLHTQVERTLQGAAAGTYTSAALGLRWSPSRKDVP